MPLAPSPTSSETPSRAPSRTPGDGETFGRLLQLITGHWVTQALHCVARLDIATLLRDGPRSTEDLAAETGAHEPSLHRVLRALASVGVFAEVAPRHFALTPLGEWMRADHPRSMRGMALFQGAAPHWAGWGSLLHAVRTGRSAFEQVHGRRFFDYLAHDTEFGGWFDMGMTSMSAPVSDEIARSYDFGGIRRLVDVGGGHGLTLAHILAAYPGLRGAVFDLPRVVAGAPAVFHEAGVSDRAVAIGGDFFGTLPPADAYIAKHIVHDWDDDHSVRILRGMAAGLATFAANADRSGDRPRPTLRVLLVEGVLTEGDAPDFGKLLDLEMLHATHGGRERTADEFAALFTAAGLRLRGITRTSTGACIIEGRPVAG